MNTIAFLFLLLAGGLIGGQAQDDPINTGWKTAQAQADPGAPGDPLPVVEPPPPVPVVAPECPPVPPPPVCLPVPSCPPPVVCPTQPPPPPVTPPPPPVPPCAMKPVKITGPSDFGGFVYWSLAGKGKTFGTLPDNQNAPSRSKLRLFEKTAGVSYLLELGPAHSRGKEIVKGQGRFSHWSNISGTGESIRFSASDNSDPRSNGKVYTYCVP